MGLMLGGNIIANNHEYGFKENVNEELAKAEQAKTDAINAANQALSSQNNAKTSETICKASENNSKASEDNAKTYMDNAKESYDNAKAYAESIDPNSFVKKSGDTMLGNLSIQHNASDNGRAEIIAETTEATDDNIWSASFVMTRNNFRTAYFESGYDTTNLQTFAQLVAHNVKDNVDLYNSIQANITNDGTFRTFANPCSADNSICTTVSHNSNYVKLGNGLIIQFGIGSATNTYLNVQTITFPIAFSNTNYQIAFGTLLSTANGKCEKMFHIQNKSTTKFEAECSYTGGTNNTTIKPTWIAIGF